MRELRESPLPFAGSSLLMLTLGVGLLLFLSVPRDLGEAWVRQCKRRLGRWLPHG